MDGDGFPRQQAAIATYAERNNLDIVRYFREEAVSGTKESMERPAFIEMRSLMVANGVKTVVIERLDRLARDLMVQETAIEDFAKHGLTLISVAEPDLDSEEPSRVMMRQMFGVIAQYEKTMIVHKLRGARKRMRDREGKCEGAKPYGQHPDIPGEADVLAEIMQWDKDGLSVTEIAKRLNDRGILPRRGKRWHHYTITRILGHDKFTKETALAKEGE